MAQDFQKVRTEGAACVLTDHCVTRAVAGIITVARQNSSMLSILCAGEHIQFGCWYAFCTKGAMLVVNCDHVSSADQQK